MSLTKQLKLFIVVLFAITGIWLMVVGYKSSQKVSNFETKSSQVTVIELSEKNRSFNWSSFGGILLLSVSIILGANTYLSKKSPSLNLLDTLTKQEQKISAFIKQGMTNKEISQELSISLSTVKTHINNIYKKLGVNSRSEFLNIAENRGD